MAWNGVEWETQKPKAERPLCAERGSHPRTQPRQPVFLANPLPSCSAGTRTRGEGADSSSGGWHRSHAICSQLPPAWVVAARPQPAPTPLTSRQRALTLSLCVLSNLPDIAAWSLSTVLFHACSPPQRMPRLLSPPSVDTSPVMLHSQCWQAETHRPPRGSVLRGAIPASRVWVTWHGMAAVPGRI